jgi:hypothetical protein
MLDYTKVNVIYTPPGGSAVPLSYNDGCGADGGTTDGWQYDNLQTPTAIVLCPSSCTSAQGTTAAQLNVELGCKTQGSIPPR